MRSQPCDEGIRLNSERRKSSRKWIKAEADKLVCTSPCSERRRRATNASVAYEIALSAYIAHVVACMKCRRSAVLPVDSAH